MSSTQGASGERSISIRSDCLPCLGGDVGAEAKAEVETEAVAMAAAEEEAESFWERVKGRFAGKGRSGAGGGPVGYDSGELLSVVRRFSFLFGGMLG